VLLVLPEEEEEELMAQVVVLVGQEDSRLPAAEVEEQPDLRQAHPAQVEQVQPDWQSSQPIFSHGIRSHQL
jgi:hypothetical protein